MLRQWWVKSAVFIWLLLYFGCLGGGKGSDSEDDEPAAKKKATPALVRHIILFCHGALISHHNSKSDIWILLKEKYYWHNSMSKPCDQTNVIFNMSHGQTWSQRFYLWILEVYIKGEIFWYSNSW